MALSRGQRESSRYARTREGDFGTASFPMSRRALESISDRERD